MKINAKNPSPFGGRDEVLGKIFRALRAIREDIRSF